MGKDISKKTCKIVLIRLLEQNSEKIDQLTNNHLLRIDLREKPVSQNFHGREKELSQLETWIIEDKFTLVGVFGLGGIGKTQLLIKFVEKVKDKFEYVFWKNPAKYSPTLEDFLTYIESYFLAKNEESNTNKKTISQRILKLIEFLNKHRCLLIFDQWEELINTKEIPENQQIINSNYQNFLRQFLELEHKSSLIFSSSQAMNSFVHNPRFKELSLAGLNNQDCGELLKNFDFKDFRDGSIEILIKKYKGHPLALQSAAKIIQNFHNGNIADFLQGTLFISDVINNLLDKQFSYLSNLEIIIMQKLVWEEEPISLIEIYDFDQSFSKSNIMKAIEKLLKIGLITQSNTEKFVTFWISYPLISKYIKTRY